MLSLNGTTPYALEDFDPVTAALIRRAAKTLSRSPGFSVSDQPDIEQEFRVHLLEKAPKFDPERANYYAFARQLITNKKRTLRRATRRQMRDHRRKISIDVLIDTSNGPASLAQALQESDGRRHTGQRRPTEAELAQLKLDIAEANQQLPQSLREMAALLSHVAPFAAAQVVGISRRRAAAHLAALRECYEARGFGD